MAGGSCSIHCQLRSANVKTSFCSSLGSFVRYLSCRLHHFIPSRHRSLDLERTVAQGLVDSLLDSPRTQRQSSPAVGSFLLFRAQTISCLCRKTWRYSQNNCLHSIQQPFLGRRVPGPCPEPPSAYSFSCRAVAHLTRSDHTPLLPWPSLSSHQTLDGVRVVSLACDLYMLHSRPSYPKRVHDEPLSAITTPSALAVSIS